MADVADVVGAEFDFTDEHEAIRALQARGVTGATDLLQHATPKAIIAACRQWDGAKHVGVGLLVRMVRDGGVQDVVNQSPGQRLRATFDDYAARHSVGSVAVPHHTLQKLRRDLKRERDYPGDNECAGGMVVIDAAYPLLVLQCDQCGLEFGLPAGQLNKIASAA